MYLLKKTFFSLLCFFVFFGCKAKPVEFAKPYPAPAELPVNLEDARIDQYPARVYWSQTLSERGYAQDRSGRVNPPPEFEHFMTAFDDTVFRYTPYYAILQTQGAYLRWQGITEKEFSGALHPTKEAFYNALGGGSFENGIGPLMMLYDGELVKADDLTIVITDLEEQGLNNMKLAASIRKVLGFFPAEDFSEEREKKGKNAGAVIAVKLPFNGINYKPNADRREEMLSQRIYGEKPLYIVATGLRDPVTLFVNAFKANAERNGVDCRIVSTVYPSERARITAGDVLIPPSASMSDQMQIDKNKRALDDLWNERNASAFRLWNLRDATKSGMFEDFGVKTPLNLHIFEYKPLGGGSKNGRRLWQLNIGFEKTDSLSLKDAEAVIENYRFLTRDASTDSEEETGKKKTEKKDSGKKKKTEKILRGVWERNDTIMQRDLEIALVDDTVYIVPRNKKRPAQESSVLYFEAVLRAPAAVPEWVSDFNDASGGSTAGKTRGFYTFVEGILGIQPGEKTNALPAGHELLRLPVVLTGLPANPKKFF
ncbi:MAG: hypothetical protein LBG87_01365 [Spirochaetaceae bacterium]|nr:hypothetical protein [Spirochaetaceae bacterium]